MTRPARLGHDLDAVPVANATDRTAPTWEARALAAEARLAALREAAEEWREAWTDVALSSAEPPGMRQIALTWLSARSIVLAHAETQP